MRDYWSCSKLANLIRGTKSPGSQTLEGWKSWEDSACKAHPIRYWIADTALDKIQDFLCWPHRRIYDIRCYLENRFITHSHQLTAHADHLPRGRWVDVDNRFLPCLFDTLVDFVEIEKAYSYAWNKKGYRFVKGRCPKAGVDCLTWETSLVYNEDEGVWPGDKFYGLPTRQAKSAKVLLELYNWWTQVYPNRPSPSDASGWSDYCDEMRGTGHLFSAVSADKDSRRIMKTMRRIEDQYEKEDTEMMCRLIKVRGALWT